MPRVSLERKTRLGVKALRVLLGMKGHRPSSFNACVGAAMAGAAPKSPGPGEGGMRNVALQKKFVEAVIGCKANVSPATKARWGV